MKAASARPTALLVWRDRLACGGGTSRPGWAAYQCACLRSMCSGGCTMSAAAQFSRQANDAHSHAVLRPAAAALGRLRNGEEEALRRRVLGYCNATPNSMATHPAEHKHQRQPLGRSQPAPTRVAEGALALLVAQPLHRGKLHPLVLTAARRQLQLPGCSEHTVVGKASQSRGRWALDSPNSNMPAD